MNFTMADAVAVSLAVCVLGYAMDWFLKQLHAASETLDAAKDGTLLEDYDPDDLWILQADEPEDDRSDELDAEGRRGL